MGYGNRYRLFVPVTEPVTCCAILITYHFPCVCDIFYFIIYKQSCLNLDRCEQAFHLSQRFYYVCIHDFQSHGTDLPTPSHSNSTRFCDLIWVLSLSHTKRPTGSFSQGSKLIHIKSRIMCQTGTGHYAVGGVLVCEPPVFIHNSLYNSTRQLIVNLIYASIYSPMFMQAISSHPIKSQLSLSNYN